MSIFKKYDIRGKYPSELDEKTTERIGKAAVRVLDLKGKVAAVGMDIRNSSPSLKESLIEGLIGQGCDVIDVGTVATPMIYYEVVEEKLPAGFMISASHNPKEYNGIKICGKRAMDITYGTGIEEIGDMVGDKFDPVEPGTRKKKDMADGFIDKITSKIDISGRLRVVVDPGNGSASMFAKELFQRMGCEVFEINGEPDGGFPNRPPDPEEDIEKLKEKVREKSADLGVAFDGDADRALFVDENGKKIPSDYIISLFVRNFVEKGDRVVYEVKCSRTLEDVIEEVGAEPILSRTGRSYIKRKMIQKRAKLGGELSGHLYFRENDYYDDPFFATGKVLEIIDGSGRLSELVGELPKYSSSPELRIECDNKEEVVERIKEDFQDEEIVDIDGAKIYFDEGWALVRPSNTEEKLSIRFEAESEEALNKIKGDVMDRVDIHKKF